MATLISDVLVQGLAYGILAIAITLTYNILDFADLSVDGSFPLGAVIAAMAILNKVPVPLAMGAAFIGGALAGSLTGLLHVKLKISGLLSGILVMTGLYSINLMVGGNRSNLPVFNEVTLFTIPKWVTTLDPAMVPWVSKAYPIVIVLLLVMGLKWTLDWFLNTKLGFLMRITGDNPQLVTALGEDIGKTKIIGLMLSNGIAAVAGSIIMQLFRFYDISMGSGTVVAGLASVVLGITVFSWAKSLKLTSKVILGSLVYRLSIAVALSLKLPPCYLKLMSVVIFVSAIVINNGTLKNNLSTLTGGFNHAKTDSSR